MFRGEKITKVIKIEGMSCMHCSKKVEEALKSLKGVKKVEVDLEKKEAIAIMKQEIDAETLKNVIEELGYEVMAVE